MKFKRIAVDTSKSVFTLHGVDEQDRPILRQNLSRARFETFFAKLSPTEVVLEALAAPTTGVGSCRGWATRCG